MADVIRPCTDQDLDEILEVINDAAQAYKGVIPNDRFKDPYMPREELRHEIAHGVRFWGFEQDGQLLGVMGLQDVEDVTLIRHAYVRTTHRRRGIGGRLLNGLRSKATRPLLVGTWAAAEWAIEFYRQHGFRWSRGTRCRPAAPLLVCAQTARLRPPSCWQRKPGWIEADLAFRSNQNRRWIQRLTALMLAAPYPRRSDAIGSAPRQTHGRRKETECDQFGAIRSIAHR